MQHATDNFPASGGEHLFYQVWRLPAEPRATLVIVHGLGEHSGRYLNVVNHLAPQGYAIYALDHRGHGRSPGRRGHLDDWSLFREDLRAFVRMVQTREVGRPFFLMGHSLGGCMVLDYVLHYPDGLAAVVASAPAVGRLNVSPGRTLMSKLLAKIKPDLSFSTGLDETGISREPAVVEAYRHDPLVHGKGTPALGICFMQTAEWTLAHAADFQPPLLLLHGEADRLVNVAGSRKFYEQVKQPDKKLIVYPGGYHESHNDLHKEQMLADLESWLEAHL